MMTEYIITKDDFELLQENPAYLDSAFKFARIYDLKHEPREEIIRCRDCKHFKFSKSGSLACTRIVVVYDSDGYREERHLCLLVNPDGFCSWVERDDDAEADR